MGSSQSVLSSEAAVGLVVVAGALGFGYSQLGQSAKPSSAPPTAESSSKKGKKKKKATASVSPPPEILPPSPPTPVVVPFPKVIPGGFDGTTTTEPESAPEVSKSTKSKKKKKSKLASSTTSVQPDSAAASILQPETQPKGKGKGKGKDTTPSGSTISLQKEKPASASKAKETPATSSPETSTRPLAKLQSSMSIDTDSSWTRVESRKTRAARLGDAATTSASEADPTTGTSSPVAERTDADDEDHLYTARSLTSEPRRPLAERLLPKPRKTGVDDMLETPDYAPLARVMRVQPRPGEKPAAGFSWGDYEDVRNDADADAEDDDAGWGVVKSRRSRSDRSSASQTPQVQAQQAKAPETLTKRQRQNAQKREAQKAAKAQVEEERLATLAKHQRELEKERMKEQFGKGGR
ncbi:hypothetical protein H0H92_011890 [Tricholoma furcatifolium]|nr:hypothetical protein H0H92_011890 [Tricholoma furcatifolium]